MVPATHTAIHGTVREGRRIMTCPKRWSAPWSVFAALVGIAGLPLVAHRADATSGAVGQRVIRLKPSITFVKASFLTQISG